jgi:hypothetical protein
MYQQAKQVGEREKIEREREKKLTSVNAKKPPSNFRFPPGLKLTLRTAPEGEFFCEVSNFATNLEVNL